MPVHLLQAAHPTPVKTTPVSVPLIREVVAFTEPVAGRGCSVGSPVTQALQLVRPCVMRGIRRGKAMLCVYGKPLCQNRSAGPWDVGTKPCHLRERILQNILKSPC